MEYRGNNLIEIKPKLRQSRIFILLILILVLAMFAGNIYLIVNSPNKTDEDTQMKAESGTETEMKSNTEINTDETNKDEVNSQQETSKIANKKVDKHTYEFKRKIVVNDRTKKNMENIYNSEEKVVYLTFDDGPSKKVTIPILDLLKKENIKATFFTLGSRVELYPEIVRREYQEGHYIANHSYSHKYSSIYESVDNVVKEYEKTEKAIREALGDSEYSSHLFRFPGGLQGGKSAPIKKEAAKVLEENGVFHIDWNSLTGDAEGKKTTEAMMKYMKSSIKDKNSVVLLMHDAGDKKATYEALPEIIAYFRENGYAFKNFYDVLGE